MRNWLLPEYVEDVLPAEAARMEQVRRRLLDLFRGYGYRLVVPPLLEYLESLNTGTGRDLDLATFKVVDLLSGRLMGVRADITPQVARMDAHLLNQNGVTRLCYAGGVLRTRPDGLAQTRNPLQVGAELFGHAGIESDVEIQGMMVAALQAVGLASLHMDFSHVGIFRSVVRHGAIDLALEQALHAALQSKDAVALRDLAAPLGQETRQALLELTGLNGGIEVLERARQKLPVTQEIRQALADLEQVARSLASRPVTVSFDLADLRGYHYHSGMLFSVYADGHAGPLVSGGRYDEVGAAFGRARPATGFSLDLRGLMMALPEVPLPDAILAPLSSDAGLAETVAALRNAGEIVITDLPGHEAARAELGCTRALVKKTGGWVVATMTEFKSG